MLARLIALAVFLLPSFALAQGTNFRALTGTNAAPACSDTVLTVPTSGADYRTSAGCPTVVKLSQYGIASDTGPLNVETPSPIGTDQTAAIQAVLDLNKTSCTSVTTVPSVCSPLTVIVDVRATVTALTVNSNTRILCVPGDGLLLKAAGPGPILRNSNKSYGTATGTQYYDTLGSFGNTALDIEGCTFNEQRANQTINTFPNTALYTNGMPAAVAMYGVQNLKLLHNAVYSSIWYNFHLANDEFVTAKDNTCDASPFSAGGAGSVAGASTDCIHVNGPAAHGYETGNWSHVGDDAFPLNADDGNGNNTIICGWFPCTGDITDWAITDWHLFTGLDGVLPDKGMELLSTHALLDRIYIGPGFGQTRDVAYFLTTDSGAPIAGNGNFGNITIQGPGPVVAAAGNFPEGGYLASVVQGKRLTIRDLSVRTPAVNQPLVYLGGAAGSGFSEVIADNVYQVELSADAGSNFAVPAFKVDAGYGGILISNSASQSNVTPEVEKPLVLVNSGTTSRILISNADNYGVQSMVDVATGATVTLLKMDGAFEGASTGCSAAQCPALLNNGTVTYYWDTGLATNLIAGNSYSGTAPVNVNTGTP